jgi:hypothetical protein
MARSAIVVWGHFFFLQFLVCPAWDTGFQSRPLRRNTDPLQLFSRSEPTVATSTREQHAPTRHHNPASFAKQRMVRLSPLSPPGRSTWHTLADPAVPKSGVSKRKLLCSILGPWLYTRITRLIEARQ